MSDTLTNSFVGKNADYYLEAFKNVSAKRTSWNWAAFILGIGWMFYRRMYLYAVIVGAVMTAVIILEMLFSVPVAISNGISMGIWVMYGMLGNTLYKTFVDKKIAAIEAGSGSEQEKLVLASSQGNPSILIGFTGFFLFAAVVIAVIILIPLPQDVLNGY